MKLHDGKSRLIQFRTDVFSKNVIKCTVDAYRSALDGYQAVWVSLTVQEYSTSEVLERSVYSGCREMYCLNYHTITTSGEQTMQL